MHGYPAEKDLHSLGTGSGAIEALFNRVIQLEGIKGYDNNSAKVVGYITNLKKGT